MKYKLLVGNNPPYSRCKPEPVLESPNVILYCDSSIITDKSVDFDIPGKVLIDREYNRTYNGYSSSLDP
jgi:hypothetical protein